MDYIGKKIHYKSVIEFKGIVVNYLNGIDHFVIKIKEWLGEGYPQQIYYLSKSDVENEQKTKLYQD